MVPVCLYIAGGFLEQHKGSPSHLALGPQLGKKNTSGTHSGEKASANMSTLGDGPNAPNPSLTRRAWQPKSKPFSKPQHLHYIQRCVALKISRPWRSETDLYWITKEASHNHVAQPLSNPLWSE